MAMNNSQKKFYCGSTRLTLNERFTWFQKRDWNPNRVPLSSCRNQLLVKEMEIRRRVKKALHIKNTYPRSAMRTFKTGEQKRRARFRNFIKNGNSSQIKPEQRSTWNSQRSQESFISSHASNKKGELTSYVAYDKQQSKFKFQQKQPTKEELDFQLDQYMAMVAK